MAAGRLLGEAEPRRPWKEMAACVALAWLPDVDALWLFLGAPDRGILGHRGFTHTPLFALAVGLAVGAWWRARGRRAWLGTGLAAFLLVVSHGLLDGIAQEGRGILYLWPFSMERFHLPWRPIPDAPMGLAFFTRVGLTHFAIELGLFMPFTVFALGRRALWTAPVARVGARAPRSLLLDRLRA
jgi:inner membrane protein